MIKNKRQFAATRKKHAALVQAAEQVSGLEADVLHGLADELQEQLAEYEAVVAGDVTAFNFQSLDELGDIACKARLASGMTQRRFAELLGVSEQMVQRDEAGSYAGAGLARVAEAFDALGFDVRGSVCPVDSEPAYFHFRAHEPDWSTTSATSNQTALHELFYHSDEVEGPSNASGHATGSNRANLEIGARA